MTTLYSVTDVIPSISASFITTSAPLFENQVAEERCVFTGWQEKWPGTSFYVAKFNDSAAEESYEYTRGYLAMVCMGGAQFAPFSLEQGQEALDSYPGQEGDRGYSMFG